MPNWDGKEKILFYTKEEVPLYFCYIFPEYYKMPISEVVGTLYFPAHKGYR